MSKWDLIDDAVALLAGAAALFAVVLIFVLWFRSGTHPVESFWDQVVFTFQVLLASTGVR